MRLFLVSGKKLSFGSFEWVLDDLPHAFHLITYYDICKQIIKGEIICCNTWTTGITPCNVQILTKNKKKFGQHVLNDKLISNCPKCIWYYCETYSKIIKGTQGSIFSFVINCNNLKAKVPSRSANGQKAWGPKLQCIHDSQWLGISIFLPLTIN